MKNVELQLAKLDTLYKRIKQFHGQRGIYNVSTETGYELFNQYAKIRDYLKQNFSDQFSDLEVRDIPVPTDKIIHSVPIGATAPDSPVFFKVGQFSPLVNDIEDIFVVNSVVNLKAIEESQSSITKVKPMSNIDIFISHSSADRELAEGLVNLLKAAFLIEPSRIRCTSLNGHRLPAGAHTDTHLMQEIRDCEVFIGLVTPKSIKSSYVLFELGARWGNNRPTISLLAAGAKSEVLPGTLPSLNALSCDDAGQLMQMVEDIAPLLNKNANRPESYLSTIEKLVKQSTSLAKMNVESIRLETISQIEDPIDPNPHIEDILAALNLYIDSVSNENEKFIIKYSEADKALKFPEGTALKHLSGVARDLNYLVHNEGEKTILLQKHIPSKVAMAGQPTVLRPRSGSVRNRSTW